MCSYLKSRTLEIGCDFTFEMYLEIKKKNKPAPLQTKIIN